MGIRETAKKRFSKLVDEEDKSIAAHKEKYAEGGVADTVEAIKYMDFFKEGTRSPDPGPGSPRQQRRRWISEREKEQVRRRGACK